MKQTSHVKGPEREGQRSPTYFPTRADFVDGLENADISSNNEADLKDMQNAVTEAANRADNAVSVANSAVTKANEAATAANNAQSTADEAKRLVEAIEIPDADDSTKGIMKLYYDVEEGNHDGAISQGAIWNLLDDLMKEDGSKKKLVKLYNEEGYNFDGAPTQGWITETLENLKISNNNKAGLVKLYDKLGDNDDGAIHQNAIKNILDKFRDPQSNEAFKARKLVTEKTINGSVFTGDNNIIYSGISPSYAKDSAKWVSIENYTPTSLTTICVFFQNANTAENVTLNVNKTGDFPILVNNQSNKFTTWGAYQPVLLTYLSGSWHLINPDRATYGMVPKENGGTGVSDPSLLSVAFAAFSGGLRTTLLKNANVDELTEDGIYYLYFPTNRPAGSTKTGGALNNAICIVFHGVIDWQSGPCVTQIFIPIDGGVKKFFIRRCLLFQNSGNIPSHDEIASFFAERTFSTSISNWQYFSLTDVEE